MNWLQKLPGHQRSPAGLEWALWRKLPHILLGGTALPAGRPGGRAWGLGRCRQRRHRTDGPDGRLRGLGRDLAALVVDAGGGHRLRHRDADEGAGPMWPTPTRCRIATVPGQTPSRRQPKPEPEALDHPQIRAPQAARRRRRTSATSSPSTPTRRAGSERMQRPIGPPCRNSRASAPPPPRRAPWRRRPPARWSRRPPCGP
jgi:hypothetical protein